MRNKIKTLAADLLTRNGYAGFRFQDLADALGVTRASIHYHFSGKSALCEEVILDGLADAKANYEKILTHGERSFEERVKVIIELNKERYLKYNPTGRTGHPWALISRIRLEQSDLRSVVQTGLVDFRRSLLRSIGKGIEMSVARGELKKDTPVKSLSLLLVAIINSSDATTRDTRSFDALEELYLSYLNVVLTAYGSSRSIEE